MPRQKKQNDEVVVEVKEKTHSIKELMIDLLRQGYTINEVAGMNNMKRSEAQRIIEG